MLYWIAVAGHSLKDTLLIIRLNRLAHLPPAQNMAEILLDRGVDCRVAQLGSHELTAQEPCPTFTLHLPLLAWFGPLRPILLCLYSAGALVRKIRRNGRPKLLVAHGILEQIVAFCVGTILKIPYLVHVHEIYDPADLSPVNRLFLSLERFCLRQAKYLIFPGNERRNIYVTRYQLHQSIFVIPNCPRLRELRGGTLPFLVPAESRVMSYVGGIGDDNAIVEGVIAASQIPGLHFAIAGWSDRPYRRLIEEAAKRFGVEDRVHLLGPIRGEAKWKLLEASDLTLCVYKPANLRMRCNATPSNKLFESMAAGKPMVGGISPDFRAFLTENRVGLFVDSGEPGALSAAIQKILENPKGAKAMGAEGYRLHRERFNYETQLKPLIEALSALFPALSHRPAEAPPQTLSP
ncbi:MAG: glycosyltransferase [Deltaproteobacteria bacterium]|nr:glycosyltransferase [Deltaproteobacteria bacterium]MBI3294489.1 glycosyltransferase [Deltaproteobacteria bacterium]